MGCWVWGGADALTPLFPTPPHSPLAVQACHRTRILGRGLCMQHRDRCKRLLTLIPTLVVLKR